MIAPAGIDEAPKCPSAFQEISRPGLRERECAGGHSLWGGGLGVPEGSADTLCPPLLGGQTLKPRTARRGGAVDG
jgi:hypothetical protein